MYGRLNQTETTQLPADRGVQGAGCTHGQDAGHCVLNICVAYGIPGNESLNQEFWEQVVCYMSKLGNAGCILLTDANFNFDLLHKIPAALLTALADGWLVDADCTFSILHGTPCACGFTTAGKPSSRIDGLLVTLAQAGTLTDVRALESHSLPGHAPVCFTFSLDTPMQKVVKMKKLPPPPPQGRVRTLIKSVTRYSSHTRRNGTPCCNREMSMTFGTGGPGWAEEIGMALTCTHLTLDTPNPTLPFAPKNAPRGHGTERMPKDTTLAPTGLAPNGGPRTRILSKITGALGALRRVIQWQRAQLGIRGKRVPASAKRKASQVFRPGAVPRQVELSLQAACRRTRKIALAFREDLLPHEFVASAPDPSLPLIRPLPALVDCMSLCDNLCALGKRYARYEERARIDKWKSKMDQA